MKTVLIYSGGMDSTVLLYDLIKSGAEVSALTIHYGQKHNKEINHAESITADLGIEHKVVNISSISEIFGTSSLTSTENEIPSGHYEEESMKQTVVPNRNMIFLALATAWSISLGYDSVSYAAHSGDHAIYPDCRNEFADAMNHAMKLCDWNTISLHRPYVDLTKADIVRRGFEISVPFKDTWSCYQGKKLHCGCCGTCVERREAFHLANTQDPTQYSTNAPSLEYLISNNWRV